jgi:hypothetical protein
VLGKVVARSSKVFKYFIVGRDLSIRVHPVVSITNTKIGGGEMSQSCSTSTGIIWGEPDRR